MPLRLCLVGAGHMGKIHARKLAGMRDVTLTCIVDARLAEAQKAAREHGVAASDHYLKALGDGIQAAVIASTTESHYPIARELLERGVSVFIEKPVAASPAEARELIDLAGRKGLVLQVGHLERFSPPFRKARAAITEPLLIEAHRISPFTGRSTDIDVVHDLMIHDIDLVLSLVKGRITGLCARGTPVLTGKIDVAYARIEFAGGCLATLAASRVSRKRERVFRVFDGARWFSLDLAAGELLTAGLGKSGRMEVRTWRASRQDPVHDELRAFVRAVRNRTEPVVGGEDGLRALGLADDIEAEIEASLGAGGGMAC
ncbi:MAG: Gfo/Idh/MocA family oxidoreductase [Syntrophorhabdales bacterium]|jgi:predicted dehydrogenase